mgnify:CR=1 FL=1
MRDHTDVEKRHAGIHVAPDPADSEDQLARPLGGNAAQRDLIAQIKEMGLKGAIYEKRV